MVTNTKSKEGQDDLNKRLRSLKIDRGPAPSPTANNRAPKLLLLGISALIALVALGYVFLFSGTKTISVVPVRTENGAASAGERVVVGGAGGRQKSVAARIAAKQEFAGYWEYVVDDAIFTATSSRCHLSPACGSRRRIWLANV